MGRLDLSLCLAGGQVFRWYKSDSGSWFGVEGRHWYRFTWEGATTLEVETNASQVDVSSLLRLDWDADAIESQIAELDPGMRAYMEALRGLRVLRPSDAEETFFSFLCTPNNNVARITQMVRQLASYGPIVEVVDGMSVHRFPTAEEIASIPESELRDRKFGYRAGTITSAARQLLDRGPGWLSSLKTCPYEVAHEELIQIKGIGRKLSDCICLFALDHTEAVPVDTHIWQQVVRLYRPEWADKSLTDARYLEAGGIFRERFGKLAGWAHQFLFYDNLTRGR